MPALTCYRLKGEVDDNRRPDFDDFVSDEDGRLTTIGPTSYPDFEAKLYWAATPPRAPLWGSFLSEGMDEAIQWPTGRSASALLIVRFESRRRHEYFAFTFGPAGRFFLRDDAYHRGYGLKIALNLMYPIGAVAGSGQGLRTLDSKRRAATVVRARTQATSVAPIDVFDIDRLRDVVGGVEGRPADQAIWGRTVGGTDAFTATREVEFAELGRFCREIDAVFGRTDYRAQFAWLDHIQPVMDPVLVNRLRERVVELIRAEGSELDLAPPEIVDWTRIDRFELPFDRRRRVRHHDLRLTDLRAVLRREQKLDNLDYRGLRQRRLSVLVVDGQTTYRWSLWSCLTGEFELDGHSYVIDEGDFFEVQADYLADLNAWIDELPHAGIQLPECDLGTREDVYNANAAQAAGCILLDRQTVRVPGSTPIEVCDLLTHQRDFIHVKKNSGSSDLSHLFSQGVISATVLQEEPDFRVAAAERLRDLDGRADCDVFAEPWNTTQIRVVFAIVDRRWPAVPSTVLPFFSKVNLRRSVRDLSSRGYQVALLPIPERV